MSGLGLSDLGSVFNRLGSDSGVDWGNWKLWVEGGSNWKVRVEGGSDKGFGVEHRKARIGDAESSSVGDVLDSLELTVGVNVGVSSGDSAVGVADLLFGRVQVSVAVVQVAELILSLELAAGDVGSCVRGSGGIGSCNCWGSSVREILRGCTSEEGRNCNLSI